VVDPNYFKEEAAGPQGVGVIRKVLEELEALREEHRVSTADIGAAVADTVRKAEEISRNATKGLREELEGAVRQLRTEMAEVKRASGTVETGVGETRAALVELVEYDRQRRVREEADREKQERLARAAKAAEINRTARLHHRSGRREEAIACWKRAVELEPKEFDTLFNLGSLLVKSGRGAEARPYLERFLREAPPPLYGRDFPKVRAWLEAIPA